MMERKIKEITEENIQDFMKLYKVFRMGPYYENWTDELILDEYNDLAQDAHICGFYLNNKCVGLVTFRPMRLSDKHPVKYDRPEKVAYMADISVLKKYRCRGIGTALMEHAIRVSKQEGFETLYMKTLEIGKSMSYDIAIKLGFKLLEGVTSIDTMERLVKGRSKEDLKIYLDRALI